MKCVLGLLVFISFRQLRAGPVYPIRRRSTNVVHRISIRIPYFHLSTNVSRLKDAVIVGSVIRT